jgi:hypothetical protein
MASTAKNYLTLYGRELIILFVGLGVLIPAATGLVQLRKIDNDATVAAALLDKPNPGVSTATGAEWFFTMAGVVLILVGLIMIIIKYEQEKKSSA